MIREDELIHIGRLVRTHGTGGDLQCRMLNTLWEDNEAEFIILRLEEIFVPFRVTDWRTKGAEDVLLTLKDVDSEQQAARFVGAEAYMLRSDLPDDTQQAADLSSLTGYTLIDSTHGKIGTITAIDTSTLNTLVQLDNGALLPLHEDFITAMDSVGKSLTVQLPDGLIDD